MRKTLVLVTGMLIALGMFTGTALAARDWGDIPPHGHVLIIGLELEPGPEEGTMIATFKKCVELAGGKPLPNAAHHLSVHTGQAGEALAQAGHAVVPLAPLTEFEGCEDFESGMVIPAPPEE